MSTVGHGALTAEAFAAVVAGASIELVVDVRSYPGSRRHPQFGRSRMEAWLPGAGVGYEWLPALGGRRRPLDGSPNTALRHAGFRGYADHMATPEFGEALDGLVGRAAERRTAVMCAEALWWQCHRRLLADALVLLRGIEVRHVFHDGRTEPHRLTEGVRVDGPTLVYDAGQASLS